jgi:hypothetical protein
MWLVHLCCVIASFLVNMLFLEIQSGLFIIRLLEIQSGLFIIRLLRTSQRSRERINNLPYQPIPAELVCRSSNVAVRATELLLRLPLLSIRHHRPHPPCHFEGRRHGRHHCRTATAPLQGSCSTRKPSTLAGLYTLWPPCVDHVSL